MKIANIYPVANQELYEQEEFVMILAHLAEKGLYKSEHFNGDQYIIMDNGAYEKEQVSINLQDLIDLAKKTNLPVAEFVVPDKIGDLEATLALFDFNRPIIRANPEYKYMVVIQAKNDEELIRGIKCINAWKGQLPLIIGIPRLPEVDRYRESAIEIYKASKFPIHFLGIQKSFSELNSVPFIRSCDTSQLAYIAKHENVFPDSVWLYKRGKGSLVDLEHDCIHSTTISKLRKEQIREGTLRGIL